MITGGCLKGSKDGNKNRRRGSYKNPFIIIITDDEGEDGRHFIDALGRDNLI